MSDRVSAEVSSLHCLALQTTTWFIIMEERKKLDVEDTESHDRKRHGEGGVS